jgi:hypothetical protein
VGEVLSLGMDMDMDVDAVPRLVVRELGLPEG